MKKESKMKMTLAEKLRFLADRAEDGKEFYWANITMKFDSETMMLKKRNGDWIFSYIGVNDVIDYHDVELKPRWEFTEDEKVILRNLPDEFRWIARDELDNRLYVYTLKPTKYKQSWVIVFGDGMSLSGFKHLFESIKWTDEEPCEFRRYL